jgi:hypothetical protein
VHEVLRAPGQLLDNSTRTFMETRFGHDFSRVRTNTASNSTNVGLTIGPAGDLHEQEARRVAEAVAQASEPVVHTENTFGVMPDFSKVRLHTGTQAAEAARAVNARAFTVGHNIVFGAGAYQPGMPEGQRVLTHELTHVVQQRSGAQLIQRYAESTEANSRFAEGAYDVGSVLLLPYGIIRGIRSGVCLSGLEQPMIDITFSRWIPDVCTRTAGGILHSREWDAFGHCWIGCEGSRRCGRGPTAVAGTVREFYREAQRKLGTRPHDSFSQDMANQSNGRELSFTPGTCYALCDNAHRTGGLDLSAPQATCIDCTSIGSGEVPCP